MRKVSYKVHHKAFGDDGVVVQGTYEGPTGLDDELVCDIIWNATQNIDESWVTAKLVPELTMVVSDSVLEKGGCRSTSVGDIVEIDGAQYECAAIGWTKKAGEQVHG